MNVINIDVKGKQTFFCIGRQCDNAATAVVFRGLQLNEGERAYLVIDGRQTPLERNTWLVERHNTQYSGDYKAELIVEGEEPETHRSIRVFTFRVEHTLYENGELVGPNPGIVDQADVDRTVAEYVNAHQEMLRGPQGKQGAPGKDAVYPYSTKEFLNIDKCIDDEQFHVVLKDIRLAKTGNVVAIELSYDYEKKTGDEWTQPYFNMDLGDMIPFHPVFDYIHLKAYCINSDGTYIDMAGQGSYCIRGGNLQARVVADKGTMHAFGYYITEDTAGILE